MKKNINIKDKKIIEGNGKSNSDSELLQLNKKKKPVLRRTGSLPLLDDFKRERQLERHNSDPVEGDGKAVYYFTRKERAEYEVVCEEGRFFYKNQLDENGKMKQLSPCQYTYVRSANEDKNDAEFGKVYAYKSDLLHPRIPEISYNGKVISMNVHHSYLSGGKKVSSAGDFEINEFGQMESISNNSGHYKPTNEEMFTDLIYFYKWINNIPENEIDHDENSVTYYKLINGIPDNETFDLGKAKNTFIYWDYSKVADELYKYAYQMSDIFYNQGFDNLNFSEMVFCPKMNTINAAGTLSQSAIDTKFLLGKLYLKNSDSDEVEKKSDANSAPESEVVSYHDEDKVFGKVDLESESDSDSDSDSDSESESESEESSYESSSEEELVVNNQKEKSGKISTGNRFFNMPAARSFNEDGGYPEEEALFGTPTFQN